jgi:hypothetical protein
VTDAEWLTATDPAPMLECVRGTASDRKLRLTGCACARRVWSHRAGQSEVPEVELSERVADGQASPAEMRAVRDGLGAMGGYSLAWVENCLLHALLREAAGLAAADCLQLAADHRLYAVQEEGGGTWQDMRTLGIIARDTERGVLTGLVRDIFGNPFRPIAFDPRWRTADTVGLATGIYEDRAFDRLPLLADALMDAGCADEQVLGHCRTEGHVRGCWLIDLVLGKS